MKTKEYFFYLLILVTCAIAFGLPYLILGSTNQAHHRSALLPTATPTRNTERMGVMNAAIALITNSPTATITSTPTATAAYTLTSTSTLAPSITPTATASRTPIPPTSTNRPRQGDGPNSPPTAASTNPASTNVPATNRPPANPQPTSPPGNPQPTQPPILPPIINTILPPLF